MLLEDNYGKTFVEQEFPRKKLAESQTVFWKALPPEEQFRGGIHNNTSEDGQTHPTGGQYLFPQTK